MHILPIHSQNFPFVYYGCPLVLSEDKNKFIPIWKQQATDEKGHKRFHGAFTGGFTAGYHNTVGSKEGWTPSQYNKNIIGNRHDRLLSIMDEEDIIDYSFQATTSKQIHSSSSLKIIPIYPEEKRNIAINPNCITLQLLFQAKELLSEGQLSKSFSKAIESNETIEFDETSYEDQHCYSSMDLETEKFQSKTKSSAAPFELAIVEPLSMINIFDNPCGFPDNLFITAEDVPDSFTFEKREPTKPTLSTVSTPISALTPADANAALSSSYEPFENNPEKQGRYRSFLISISKGNPVLLPENRNSNELTEFNKAAMMFKPLSLEMSKRFKTANGKDIKNITKEPVHVTKEHREIGSSSELTWIPSSILCKRLGIDVPKSSDNSITGSASNTRSIFAKEILDSETMRLMIKNASTTTTQLVDMESEEHVDQIIESFENRPSLSFFKELFVSFFNHIPTFTIHKNSYENSSKKSLSLAPISNDSILMTDYGKNTVEETISEAPGDSRLIYKNTQKSTNTPRSRRRLLSFD